MKILGIIGHALFVTLRVIVRSILKFDRYVLKRYLNIETPLYKLWWSNNVEYIQKKLDKRRREVQLMKNLEVC